MNKKTAIVLVSGGIDSCVTAAIAAKRFILAFLHLCYGQKTEKREIKAFKDIATYFKVKKRLVANVKYFKDIGGSSLTDNGINIAKAGYNTGKLPNSYVPFRNTHLVSIAVSWAEVIAVDRIFLGVINDEGLGYPDTTVRYVQALNKLIKEGSIPGSGISVEAPLVQMKKEQVVKIGLEMNLPFHLTWSCYKNNDIACGECESCVRRLKGFKKAKAYDPLEYMVYPQL